MVLSFKVLDKNAVEQDFSVTTDSNGLLVGSTALADPATGAKMNVGTQHIADAETMTGNSALVAAVPMRFNGTNSDRERGNVDSTVMTMVSDQAGTPVSPDQTNYNGRGVQIGINITALANVTMTVTIQGKDVASSQYYTLLTSASLTGTGFTLLTLFPGVTPTANVAISQVLPRTWNIKLNITGTGTVSGTIGASIIV